MAAARPRFRSAREIAAETLLRVRKEGAYANLALSAALTAYAHLNDADCRLVSELVYGVLRRQSQLDHVLTQHASQPLKKLKTDVREQLRLAAYQLLFLDRIPAHAAVNEAVSSVRKVRGPKVAGFVNAILRKVTKEDLTRALPTDKYATLALNENFPMNLVRLWESQLGWAGTEALARAFNTPAQLTIRVNLARQDTAALAEQLAADGGSVTPGQWSPLAFHLSRLPRPFQHETYLQGCWTAQGEGSQLVVDLLDPQPGESILDLCAGVGGKTTEIARRVGANGRVLALDINPTKLARLREHCTRLGVTVKMRCTDASNPDPDNSEQFDRVLLDAPCSAIGLLGRHPELRWRFEMRSQSDRIKLQYALLKRGAGFVRPGGVLVYSVCSIAKEEGPEQISAFLEQHPAFVPEMLTVAPWPILLSENEKCAAPDKVGLTLWPHISGTDGFYLCRLRRVA